MASVEWASPSPDGGEPATELMGFPLPAAARASVEEIDLLAVDRSAPSGCCS